MSFIKGLLNAEVIDVEGVRLEKTRMSLDTLKKDIMARVQVQKLAMKTASPAFLILKDLIQPTWMSEDEWTLKNLSGQFRLHELQSLSWRALQAQVDAAGKIASEGEWNEEGFL